MKKILSIVLSMMMVLSLIGCGKKVDAKALYDEASKKVSEMSSMDMDYDMSMTMTQGEETIDMTMSMNMKMDGMNTENMQYLATGKTSAMGQDMDMQMYYADGYYYMETMGQKMKYAMDIPSLMEQINQSVEGANMDSSYMKEISAKADGDNQILTFTADASKMDAYVQDVMSAMGSAANMEGVTYTIKEVSGETVVNKDGYFTTSKIKMVMEMTVQGETMNVNMDMTGIYNNPGQPVTITAPSLDGYTEIDPSLLGM